MATKLVKPAPRAGNHTAGHHTAGIFSDMTVDGPVIGTLVAIMDRAKNLPNRRSMGKQDPYCAARLGKEAQKTNTDRRGGQTPRWDQELRFTVHDSPDYHQLKVSVFNDDKKTELIGETWVSLEAIIVPGGGQSDTWHGLNCKGKYAGEVRIELTFYDSRPKEEKTPAEKKQPTARSGASPAVGGPRESTPVKRRPLPTDPTAASPSPTHTPEQREQRGLRGMQAGPRSYGSPRQRPNEQTPTSQRQSLGPGPAQPGETPQRRAVASASPMSEPPPQSYAPPQQPPAPRPVEPEVLQTPPNPRASSSNVQQYPEQTFDMSYTAPKPYEVQPVEPLSTNRTMSQDDFRSSRGHSSHLPTEIAHSYSAPAVPTSYTQEPDAIQPDHYQPDAVYADPRASAHPGDYSRDVFQDPSYHVEPLRLSRHSRSQEVIVAHATQDPYQAPNEYMESQSPYEHQYVSHGRRLSAMQPTVEDEDDVPPPPPPVHRSDAQTLVQGHYQHQDHHDDVPMPLNTSRQRDDMVRYGSDPMQTFGSNDFGRSHVQERRYTHPHPSSRPVSRDTMAPSPLRNETSMLPSSLVPGYDAQRQKRDSISYQTPPSYETPSRARQLSEPDYQTPPQYEQYDEPSQSYALTRRQVAPPVEQSSYCPPEEPRRRSPVQDPLPLIKPRALSPAVSPVHAHSPADDRMSRVPNHSMPTRKSVSPRPPPSSDGNDGRRLSGVPFNPDSFDVFNPSVAKPSSSDPERPGSRMEVNENGQVVTFSGRVIDASDHLPIDSWAPEPKRKGAEKERTTRSRPALSGARDLEAARQREDRYKRERLERERMREAKSAGYTATANPSTALVSTRHNFPSDPYADIGALVLVDRDARPPSSHSRGQQWNQRPLSSAYDSPPAHSSHNSMAMTTTNVLRERENLGGYGSSPGYGSRARHSGGGPPIPAKVPLEGGHEDMALSLELQSIDIGPGSGGRRNRGTTRRHGY